MINEIKFNFYVYQKSEMIDVLLCDVIIMKKWEGLVLIFL